MLNPTYLLVDRSLQALDGSYSSNSGSECDMADTVNDTINSPVTPGNDAADSGFNSGGDVINLGAATSDDVRNSGAATSDDVNTTHLAVDTEGDNDPSMDGSVVRIELSELMLDVSGKVRTLSKLQQHTETISTLFSPLYIHLYRPQEKIDAIPVQESQPPEEKQPAEDG